MPSVFGTDIPSEQTYAVQALKDKLSQVDDAAQQLAAAQQEFEDLLTTLYIEHGEDAVDAMLAHIEAQTGLAAGIEQAGQDQPAPYIG
ncbi:MAG: hypothetical protein ABEK12_03030 [Candidatus Nanohaloarchaea archaeon]